MTKHFAWDYEDDAYPPFYHIYHLDTRQACALWDDVGCSLGLIVPHSAGAASLVRQIVDRLDALAELVEVDDAD